jgi:predicted ATPase
MGTSLDKLTIRGFKSIRELNDLELRNLNVFIGGNGAGKTNLVDFFRLLHSIIHGTLNEFVQDRGGIGDLLFKGRKVTQEMFFQTHFGIRGYQFSIKPGPSDNAFLSNEARYYKPGVTGWWQLGSSDDGTSLLVAEATGKTSDSKYSQPVYAAVSSWQIYHFHDTSKTAGMRHYEIVQHHKTLDVDASNIAPYLLRLRNKESAAYQDILNAVRLVLPFFHDFLLTVEEKGQKEVVRLDWTEKGSSFPMQPYHLSDGSIRFICLATALLQPDPPASIIIDEPELGLHPAAIAILAELMQDAAKRTQLLISTQSAALVDQFSVEDVIVVNRKDGASTFQRLERKDYDTWLERYSVGELWTKNVIAGGPVHE